MTGQGLNHGTVPRTAQAVAVIRARTVGGTRQIRQPNALFDHPAAVRRQARNIGADRALAAEERFPITAKSAYSIRIVIDPRSIPRSPASRHSWADRRAARAAPNSRSRAAPACGVETGRRVPEQALIDEPPRKSHTAAATTPPGRTTRRISRKASAGSATKFSAS